MNSSIDAIHACKSCPTCLSLSPHLYEEGWSCLNIDCQQYWLLETATGLWPIPPGMKLRYRTDFLRNVPTPSEAESVPYSVVPDPPLTSDQEAGTRSLWRGWVCDCGRANCRYRWEVCECRACGRQVRRLGEADILLAPDVCLPRDDVVGEQDESALNMTLRRVAGATVASYELPHA